MIRRANLLDMVRAGRYRSVHRAFKRHRKVLGGFFRILHSDNVYGVSTPNILR